MIIFYPVDEYTTFSNKKSILFAITIGIDCGWKTCMVQSLTMEGIRTVLDGK
ncbi:MAG: hypothetical protein KBG22_05070 [Smithella sp.]|nr:hypothetical protein [Smithella sp.]HOU50300.1 hypothetical protein [Smithella sp.]HQG64238.1 hypothetical protein [Smithella sp.]HQH16988.1 hypothetical protein [Smithella sp.]HQI72126.1 hypothetical protein [Smithella sp.]